MSSFKERKCIFIIAYFLFVGVWWTFFSETAQPYFFSVLRLSAIVIGGGTAISAVKNWSKLTHPIFTLIIGILLLGTGVFFLFKGEDMRFGSVIVSGIAIVLALERLYMFEKRKGDSSALPPIVFAVIYWIFAIFITKSGGMMEPLNLIRISGIFSLCAAFMWFLSRYLFHDLTSEK